MTNNTLKQYAHTLRLSGLLSTLELRLKEAESNRLPYGQFLEIVFQDEINVRQQRTIARRNKAADFREIRSLDNFDFAFNPSIDRARIYELAACHFIREQRDALLVGPPGVGKSHLAQAIGIEAIKAGFLVLYRSVFDLVRELSAEATQAGESRLLGKYLKPDLLLIDDMGLKIKSVPFSPRRGRRSGGTCTRDGPRRWRCLRGSSRWSSKESSESAGRCRVRPGHRLGQ